MRIVSTNFAKILVWKRKYGVILWRHKQHTTSNNDRHRPRPRSGLNELFIWRQKLAGSGIWYPTGFPYHN